MTALLLLAGFLGGILASTIGIGGGIVFVVVIPLALTALGIPYAQQAPFVVANSMLATGFSALSANVSLYRAGKVFFKPVLWISAVAVLTSYLVLIGIVKQPWYSGPVFNAVLIVLLLAMLWRTLFFKERADVNTHPNDLKQPQLIRIGAMTGIIQPLSGLGGGIIMIPVLNTFCKVPIKLAGNVSLGVVGLVSLVNSLMLMASAPSLDISIAHTGYILWPVALALSAGVVLGAPLGVKLAKRLSPAQIRLLFIAFMTVTLFSELVELYEVVFMGKA